MVIKKYKEDYYIYKNKDASGKDSENKEDIYIKAKNKIEIYRFNENTLIIYFKSKGISNNRIKELSQLGINLIPFQIGDNESTYKFEEKDFNIVSDVVKAKKRIKRNLTEEQRNDLRERLMNSRRK